MAYPYNDTPFGHGQRAFDAGLPIEANPHKPGDRRMSPEEYPGSHAEWRWGWLNRKAQEAHKHEQAG